jgi:hypothetical protein
VQADFAFFDPKPDDFHGVRLLLKTYLDSKPWDLTGFVDLILEQTTVGTVVKLADDDQEEGDGNDTSSKDDQDLFALVSVLNLGRYRVCTVNPLCHVHKQALTSLNRCCSLTTLPLTMICRSNAASRISTSIYFLSALTRMPRRSSSLCYKRMCPASACWCVAAL